MVFWSQILSVFMSKRNWRNCMGLKVTETRFFWGEPFLKGFQSKKGPRIWSWEAGHSPQELLLAYHVPAPPERWVWYCLSPGKALEATPANHPPCSVEFLSVGNGALASEACTKIWTATHFASEAPFCCFYIWHVPAPTDCPSQPLPGRGLSPGQKG